MPHSEPYSASRIRRGVFHLIGGKAITSIAGIGTFLLLVRALPVEQFAAYTILFALVELVEASTGVGLSQILSRYVPELYVGHHRNALRRLVTIVLTLRIGVLTAFVGIVYLLAPSVAPLIGLSGWEWAVKAYLAVVLVRVSAMALFGILESMLHQGIAQLGFGLVTAMRFMLLLGAYVQGGLDLRTVIVIELLTDLLGCGVMAIGLIRTMPARSSPEPEATSRWLRSNLGRMVDFGVKGYLQHMLILPYGGATNRLVVGGTLASTEAALFGFAQSVADLMERYLPVRLLAGVIRPVLTARYVRDRNFSELELAANLIFKINAIVICLAAVVVFAGGSSMIGLVTKGKYVDGGVGLLLAMCALVFLFSLRHTLDQVCQAVEHNGPLIWSNVVITSSVLPGIAFLPALGVFAMPVANIAGLILGILILVWRLRAAGFAYRQDLRGLVKMLAVTALGMLGAEASRRLGGGWIVSVAAGVALFGLAAVLVRIPAPKERILIGELVRRRRPGTFGP